MRRFLAGAAILILLFVCSALAARTHGGPAFWAVTVALVGALCIGTNLSPRRALCDDPCESALRGLVRGLLVGVGSTLVISLFVLFALQEIGGKSLLYVLLVGPVALVVGGVSGAVSRLVHDRRVSRAQHATAPGAEQMGVALTKRRRHVILLSAYVLTGVIAHPLLFKGAIAPAGHISGTLALEVDHRTLVPRRPEEVSDVLHVQHGAATRPYDIYRLDDPHFTSRQDALVTILIVPHDRSRPALMYSPRDGTSKILFSEPGEDGIRRCLSREGYPVSEFNWSIYGPLDVYVPAEGIDHGTDGFVWHGRDPVEMRRRSGNFTPEAAIRHRPGKSHVLLSLVEDNANRIRRMDLGNWLPAEMRWDAADDRETIDCRLGNPLTPVHRTLLRLSRGSAVLLDILVMPLQPVVLLFPLFWGHAM